MRYLPANPMSNQVAKDYLNTDVTKNGISSQTVFFIVIGLLIKTLLDYSFLYLLGTGELDAPYTLYVLQFNPLKLCFSYLITFVMLYFLPNGRSAASFFTQFVFFVVILPLSTVYAAKDESTLYYILVCACYLAVEIFVRRIEFAATPQTRFPNINRALEPTLWVVICITLALVVFENGLPTLGALNFRNVYVIREETEFGKYTGYLMDFAVMGCLPLLITSNFLRKKYMLCAVGLVICFFLYLQTANKAWLFIIPLICAALIILRYRNGRFLLFAMFAALLLLCIVMEYLFRATGIDLFQWPFSLINRRTLLVPAILKFNYFEFFQTNPLIGFWGTILAPFLKGAVPYANLAYTKEIGLIYAGGSNANTGAFGSELIHFGLWGIPVAALCLGIFFYITKQLTNKNGFLFVSGCLVYWILELANASALSMLSDLIKPVCLILLCLYTAHTDKKSLYWRR